MKDNNRVNIPEELQQICREMAQVARKHGLNSFSGRFQPSEGWSGDISFGWEAGRHMEEAGHIKIASQFTVFTNIDVKNDESR